MSHGYKLDHKLKIKPEDLVAHIHAHDIDVTSNHIYLFGREEYVEGLGGDSDYVRGRNGKLYKDRMASGDEPGIEYTIANRFIRNLNICMRANPDKAILVQMKTCFPGTTKVETSEGRKRIRDIKIGDLVLTHKNRYKKVTNVTSKRYYKKMVRLGYGRHGNAQTVAATADHPILVERNKNKMWIHFEDVKIGDIIFTLAKTCPESGELIPYYMNRKPKKRKFKRGGSSLDKRLINDIIPFCNQKEKEGWKMVPVGGGVIPDAIGYKNGKVVAFEIENSTVHKDYPRLKFKKTKYDKHVIRNYIDDVKWIIKGNPPKTERNPWYEVDESGFCKIKVVSKKAYTPNTNGRTVYDLTVEEDHSYVASKIVVHNCGGFWDEGMAIYNAIKACPQPITILNYTHARSMSSIIFCAANKTVMMPDSYFMIHEGSNGFGGTSKQFQSYADFSARTDTRMLDIYVDVLKGKGKFKSWSKKRIREMLKLEMDKKEEVYLTAKEAVEWGFADEIFGEGEKGYDWSSLTEYTDAQLER